MTGATGLWSLAKWRNCADTSRNRLGNPPFAKKKVYARVKQKAARLRGMKYAPAAIGVVTAENRGVRRNDLFRPGTPAFRSGSQEAAADRAHNRGSWPFLQPIP